MIFLSKRLFILTLFILFSCSDLFLSELDECGVPNGDNSSCVDCAGTPNGNAEDLGCGCGEAAPLGCDNECGSTLAFDECGVCGGDNSSCADCAGTPNGNAVEDCSGLCNGLLVIDECGVCDGNNDCYCDDENTILKDCAGFCPEDSEYPQNYDECGVCGGDNSLCLDCSGVPNGDAVIDCCGDCLGTAMLDDCGVCYGGTEACADIEMNSCVGCMLEGADNYSPSYTIPDNESCFVDYNSTIQPIFDNNCTGCHGSSGGLDLSSYQGLMVGGDNGPSVIPNNSDGSILIEKLMPNPSFGDQMDYLNDESMIIKISTWIDLGALESN